MNEQFSFSNKTIADFFNKDGIEPPTSELLYLHTHPLLRPSFLTDINDLIKEVSKKIVEKKVQGVVIDRLNQLGIELGSKLPTLDTVESAKEALYLLKEVRLICLEINRGVS